MDYISSTEEVPGFKSLTATYSGHGKKREEREREKGREESMNFQCYFFTVRKTI